MPTHSSQLFPFTQRSLLIISVPILWAAVNAFGQYGVNCDASCGGGPTDTRASVTNARGTGSLINPARQVGKTTIIEGSQSYSYTVPLFAIPGRNGLDLNLTLYYNSAVWSGPSMNLGGFMFNSDHDNPSPGFRLDFGYIDTSNGLGILVDPDGTAHLLVQGSSTTLVSQDSTFIQVVETANAVAGSPWTATFKNGRQITYTYVAGYLYVPTQIEDTNGNQITITYLNTGSGSSLNHLAINTITDTAGRVIHFFYDSTQTMLQCVTTAANCTTPNTQTFQFTWNYAASNPYVLNFNFAGTNTRYMNSDDMDTTPLFTSGTQSFNILTGVQRPDGTRVSFTYGDWGIANQVQEVSSSGQLRYSSSYNYPLASAGTLNRLPTFTQETIFDGVNTGTWNYQATVSTTAQVRNLVTSFSVMDPCGTSKTTNFSANGDWEDGLPTQDLTTSAPPTSPPANCPTVPTETWRTLNRTWTSTLGGNPLVATETTILEDNSQSETIYQTYDSNGNATDVLQKDLGSGAPGALIKEVVVSFASLGNHILDRPADIQVKDGSGTVVYHEKRNYDEVATKGQTPLPVHHDEVNYAPGSATARGNLTSEILYANAAAGTGGITSSFTYDEFGNLITGSVGCCSQQQRNFSNTTQYAYPDSVVTGPSGTQLTTSYVYNFATGTVASITDANGKITSFGYDVDNRETSHQTPDSVTVTTAYDDAAANPAVTRTNTGNSLATRSVFDGKGRGLSEQTSNGSTVVSTTTFGFNIVGELYQASNPAGPSDTVLYTTYGYDALARVTQTTPPVLSGAGSQNPYQVSYSGATLTFTDPANKQRKHYQDALGRLVRADEPGLINGHTATGALTISGTEQSVATSNGNGATAGTASVSMSGTERNTQALTHSATAGSTTITISGAEQSVCIAFRLGRCLGTLYDTGTVTITVGSYPAKSYKYGKLDTPATVAWNLSCAFHNDASSPVDASCPGSAGTSTTVVLTARTVGSATNYSFSTSSVTNDTTCANFCESSFPASPTSGTFTNGTDNGYTTEYDTGTVTVNVTINGTQYSKTSNYSQNTTPSSIASDLSSQINSDSTLNQLIIAGVSGSTLQMTTTATGASTSYPLSASAATNSQYFTSGSTSFTPTASGSTFTSGQNGTLYDAGSMKATLTGFSESPVVETASFGQGSTPVSIAQSIAGAFHNDPNSPVDASAGSGSATINFTARTQGADANNYSITIAEQSNYSSSFPTPSFTTVSGQLSGGVAPAPSLDPSVALATYYSYDPLNHLKQVSQGQQTRTYIYDGLGRTTSASIPERANAAVTFSYTDFGAISVRTDPRTNSSNSSITTTYGYDPLNRLSTVTYNDGTPGITYTYNPPNSANNTGGRLANVTNGVESDTYQYDVMGRPTQCSKVIGGNTYVIGYAFNPDGTLSSTTYPSGRSVSNTYDGIGRLTQVGTGGNAIVNINSYNAASQALTLTYGNGVSGTITFNNQLQLGGISYSNASTSLLNLTYGYGGAQDNGEIQGITDGAVSSRSTSYVYDELGRLKTAQTNDLSSANTWKLDFLYDRYGNRLEEIGAAGTAAMPNNEVSVDPTTNRLTTLTYDADGDVVNDGSHAYTYDALNQIKSTGSNSYAYNAAGLRVNKNGNLYIYSGNQLLAIYNAGAAATSPSTEFIYAGGNRTAMVDSGGLSYLYNDHLSIRVQTDSSGSVLRTLGQFPFGETWYSTGSAFPWDFTTYETDTESGLDYADARYYSSQFGRFTSNDPLSGTTDNPQSRNRFAYAMNDPINFSDPTGFNASKWDMCIYDDIGDPVRCFGLPTESQQMSEGEADYNAQVAIAFMFNNCTGTICGVITLNDNSNPAIAEFIVNELMTSASPDSLSDGSSFGYYSVGDNKTVDLGAASAPAKIIGMTLNGDLDRPNVTVAGSTPETIWTCFSSPTCDPRKYMQPAVTIPFSVPHIPTKLPVPKTTTQPGASRPVAAPITFFSQGNSQPEPVPPELLMPPN